MANRRPHLHKKTKKSPKSTLTLSFTFMMPLGVSPARKDARSEGEDDEGAGRLQTIEEYKKKIKYSMKKYLTLIAATMLTAACSNEAEAPEDIQSPGTPIAVTVDEGSLTRAPGEVWKASQIASGFGLFAAYTGRLTYENTTVSADYMYNQKVIGELNAEGNYDWVYNPIKYWPNGENQETGKNNEYVSFFAYWPYEANPKDDGRAIIGMSAKYDLGDPWINFRLPADPWGEGGQVDLMYGVKGIDLPFYDEQKPYFDEKLKIIFLHALACIGDRINIRLAEDFADYIEGYAEIYVDNITIDYKYLTTKARLVLNCPGGPNWKELVSGELTTERNYKKQLNVPVQVTKEAKELSANEGLFYIPLRVQGQPAAYAEVTITYSVMNNAGTGYKGTASTRFNLDNSLDGQKQGISLVLTKDFDLLHLTYPIIDEDAYEPSYSRQWK